MSPDAVSERWEILMVALILGAAHLISPRLYGLRKDSARLARQEAFGGGLSVAYVFLHLIPSLDAFQDVVGQRIYFVALLGFVAVYALDIRFQPPRHHHPTKYHAYLAVFFLYNGLLVFTLGLNLPSTPILTLVFAVSLAIDVLNTDLEMQTDYGSRFEKSGRWLLLAGVVIGYAMTLIRHPIPVVVDIVTAALAGFLMFQTYNGLLPASRNKNFRAFVAGLATFFVLHLLLGGVD